MAVSETAQDAINGRLIALEGDTEMLATQLRLLPQSEKFLVIPSMNEVFPANKNFDPRSYVRGVHLAFEDRIERAQTFLSSGTSAHPRLVFMNGGSASARSMCISRICRHHTDGDVGAARSLFHEIVRNGVAGLVENMSIEQEEQTEKASNVDCEEKQAEEVEIPRTHFMGTADSPKRHAASPYLNANEKDLDTSPAEIMRAMKSKGGVPVHETFTTEEGDEIVQTVLTVPSGPGTLLDQKRETFGSRYEDTNYDPYPDVASPGDGSCFSGGPPTPAVIYGEACLVDVASASCKKVRKAVSFDNCRFYPSNVRYQKPSSSSGPPKYTKSTYNISSFRTSEGTQAGHDSFPKLPRRTFLKAHETTIRRSPSRAGSLNSSSTSLPVSAARLFVDRGTDARNPMEDATKMGNASWRSENFIPVFPVVEDFILQLFAGKPDEILEFVIRTSKDGSYPAILHSNPSLPLPEQNDSLGSSMAAVDLQQRSMFRLSSYLTERDRIGCTREPEYDPYNDDYLPNNKRRWLADRDIRASNAVPIVEPLKPTMISSPTHSNADRFFDFSPVDAGNAISVQNSLRQLLSMHCPVRYYSQHYHPVAPEAQRLWKAVFSNDERSSMGNEGRTVDHIVAFGCEEGVKRDFFFQISGQIEKLGCKRDGTNRSGKLDLGYLIGQIMQRFSSGSSLSATSQLSDPAILAALLVPQIEAFLASNISTIFLILHFPFTYLDTVFELRNLLGPDLFKIAGILDTLASDPPSICGSTTPHPSSPLCNHAVAARNDTQRNNLNKAWSRSDLPTTLKQQIYFTNRQPKTGVTSFAKADFVLPRTATDVEVTDFLGGICQALIESSPSYTPEPEPGKESVMPGGLPPSPTLSTSIIDARDAHDPDFGYPVFPDRSAPSKIVRLTGYTDEGSQNNYEASVTSKHKYGSSIASNKTARTDRGRRRERGTATAVESEWDNFNFDSDEEDNYAVAPKRDEKKALKWLGLA